MRSLTYLLEAASTARKICDPLCKKTFATKSALSGQSRRRTNLFAIGVTADKVPILVEMKRVAPSTKARHNFRSALCNIRRNHFASHHFRRSFILCGLFSYDRLMEPFQLSDILAMQN